MDNNHATQDFRYAKAYLILSLSDGSKHHVYDRLQYADILDQVDAVILGKIQVETVAQIDGRWVSDGPHLFTSGRFGYDCRRQPEFGYRHPSTNFMTKLVCEAAGRLGPGDQMIVAMSMELYERYNDAEDMAAIQKYMASNGISEFVHITPIENLGSILSNGLVSVSNAKRKGIPFLCSDSYRYDGRLDGISLSIKRINHKVMYAYRRRYPDRSYVILSIDAGVVNVRPCAFFQHNAASRRFVGTHVSAFTGASALREMFPRWGMGEPGLTESVQAEVMIFGDIPAPLIRGVYLSDRQTMMRCRPILGNVPFKIAPERF